MTMTAYTFTLSRAHAVADRLRKGADAKRDEALMTLTGHTFNHVPSDDQVAALKSRGERALASLASAREGLRAVGHIRETLAQANATAGVSQLLAQIEAKKQEARLLSQLTGVDLLTLVPLAQVNDAFTSRSHENSLRGLSVRVGLVPLNAFDGLREELSVLNATISAMSDQVNDMNKKTITVELPEELAKEAGL
jgi:hypothetical protein